jgi:hypothetical protein
VGQDRAATSRHQEIFARCANDVAYRAQQRRTHVHGAGTHVGSDGVDLYVGVAAADDGISRRGEQVKLPLAVLTRIIHEVVGPRGLNVREGFIAGLRVGLRNMRGEDWGCARSRWGNNGQTPDEIFFRTGERCLGQ